MDYRRREESRVSLPNPLVTPTRFWNQGHSPSCCSCGYHDSWAAIRHKLSAWVRLTTTLRTTGGELIVCRQDARPDADAGRAGTRGRRRAGTWR